MRIKNSPGDEQHNGAQVRSGAASCRQRPGSPPSAPPLNSTSTLEHSINNNHQDVDFTHDNIEYQWFPDYNYRDGSCQHASVLSSLSSSYKGLGSLACYEELARDLDANLAEADMESFRTRDIHALLSNLPPSACHLMQDTNRRGEMYASLTSSMMEKFCFDSSFSPHSSSQGEDSTAGSINTMSICKSELLFSPVKETPTVPGHYSIDSLDCDRLEQDLILTCQANKYNYTIAFEGSIAMYSEDSDGQDISHEKQDLPGEAKYSSSSETQDINTYSTEKLRKSFRLSRPVDSSLVKSDSGLTTWSKMKNRAGQPQLRRQPSGNNNEYSSSENSRAIPLLKSQSAPDLRSKHHNYMVAPNGQTMMISNVESTSTDNQLNVPLEFLQISEPHDVRSLESRLSDGMNSSGDSHKNSKSASKPHNFNLVKLFMKQKSMSNDGIVSSATDHSSECWPNSSEAGDSVDSFSTESKAKAAKYSAKTQSNKDYQNDDCEITQSESKINTKKWVNNSSNEYSTCTFEDSLVEGTNNAEVNTKRAHDFIIEEDEISEKSEQDCDKNIYATVNKVTLAKPSINNINSFDKFNPIGSPIRVRGNATTQTKKNSSVSASISSCSESEGTQVTRFSKLIYPKDHKATSTQAAMDVTDKSMQTSLISNYAASKDRNLLKVIEPSFLEQLKKGNNQKPVYVLYPNYTLPDLAFIPKYQHQVFLKPMKYVPSSDETTKTKDRKSTERAKRPFSCNDVEGLRKKGFNHIRDWDSLTFLLPLEYRQILSEMPEVTQQLKNREDDLLLRRENPSFCASPPVKHKTRPASCDCGSLLSNNATNVSSSSSTATQPSSGYRGSSTMLTDSSAQNSPAPVPGFNPLFVYKYDSATSSETSFLNDKQRAGLGPPLPKRSISLAEQTKLSVNGKVIDVAPPRPPLPKGILRKSADKSRKTTPNTKRYSMFEMEDPVQDYTNTTNIQSESKSNKRLSLQEPYYLLRNNSIVEMKKNNDLAAKRFSQQFLDAAEKDIDEMEFFHDEGVGTESSLESGKSHDINNARPPTPPLPKCHSKLSEVNPCVYPTTIGPSILTSTDLQQLEEFLKHSGISCNDMEEWDNTQMQKVKNQVSKFLSMRRSQEGKESLNSSCSSGHSKKSVTFSEKLDQPKLPVDELKVHTSKTPPNSPNVMNAAPHRHFQVKNLAEIPICEEGESSPEGYSSPSGHSLHKQSSAEIALKKGLLSDVVEAVDVIIEEGTGSPRMIVGILCPTLYDFFCDGLRETIDTPFGPANNSVWHVIEASARQGPITKSLNELVMRINSEDAFSENVLKFNAFIMGLLNVHSLDAFVSYLRTRESILRRYYTASGLLRGAGSLFSGSGGSALVAALTRLSNINFNLDLLWQLKDMHRSFKRMEDMMSNESANTSITSNLSKNQRNILRLVHSIQSSINQSSDDQPDFTPQVSVIMRNKSHNAETAISDVLNNSANTKTLCGEKARPRSCVNPCMDNFTLRSDDGSLSSVTNDNQTRRWSGVQLGSKLMQAFNRLALYDDSEEYTDSLENEQKQTSLAAETLEYLHEESISSSEFTAERGGGKFRRLQRRWEMLSGQDSSPPRSARPVSSITSTGSGGSTPGSAGSTPGSVTGRSKIPRPVTSPVRQISSQSPTGNIVSPVKRSIPVPINSAKKVTTPPGTSNVHRAPLPPLPHGHQIQRNASGSNIAAKKSTTNTNRISRAEVCSNGPATPRPSSLPYRRAPPPSLTRPRRAASTSQPRPSAPPVKAPATKMVRTLWHRLPSDSGHLAFNEGERLRLVLEVDDQWLLCCRGQQKGLVPRNGVIPVPDNVLQKF